MDEVAAMLVRLNLETRSFHAAADAGWRDLLNADVSRLQYIEQLVHVFGFEGPLEAALRYTPNLELVIDAHERFRAGFLAQDLIGLGLKPAEVSRLPQFTIAPFTSPLEALGWMYVVERWTLGFDDVRRNLVARLPQANDAFVYLSAGEGSISLRWQQFGHQLDRAARTLRTADEIVAGANAGFRAWLDWSHRAKQLHRLG